MSQRQRGALLEQHLLLRWGEPIPLEVARVSLPEGGSYVELPGPRSWPARPFLEPHPGPGGVMARVCGGDGHVMSVALRIDGGPTLSSLREAPLSLSACAHGGFWVLCRGSLEQLDADGKLLCSVLIQGMALVGIPDDGVWVIGLGSATLVDKHGRVRGAFPWEGGFGSVSAGDRLYALGKGLRRQMDCLAPDGTRCSRQLESAPEPLEKLLAVPDEARLTVDGVTLRRHGEGGPTVLDMQCAGLTDAGEAFLSGRDEREVHLLTAHGGERRLPVPAGAPDWGGFSIAAVQGERLLGYALDYAAWYEGGQWQPPVAVDEECYERELFPVMWALGLPECVRATPDGVVLISATGPAGMALLALRLGI